MEVAIYNDCRTLIENFTKAGNARFQSFCKQWKAIAFQHMYATQTTTVELLQTTLAILHIAKRTVCGHDRGTRCGDANTQVRRRMAGMYLMYATYFKQPTEQYIKIVVSSQTWKEMRIFIDTLPSELQPATDEVRYVFWKLVESQAFSFAALDYCVGLEKLIDYDRLEDNGHTDDEHTSTSTPATRNTLEQDLHELDSTQQILPALNVLEDGYNEMKELLVTNKQVSAKTLPPTTIFKDIRKVLQNIQDILEETGENEQSEARRKAAEDESKKRNLKRKGFKAGTNKRAGGDEDDSEDSNSEPSKSVVRRMSARTIFSETLPDVMLADLHDDSQNVDDETVSHVDLTSDTQNMMDLLTQDAEDSDTNAKI